jgi:hypothetical protein
MNSEAVTIDTRPDQNVSITWGESGALLSIWSSNSHSSTFLTRQQAKALAEALTEWADQPVKAEVAA